MATQPVVRGDPKTIATYYEETWLDCTANPFDKVAPLLVPYPSDQMAAHITSNRVNNSRYNEPDCGAPLS